MVNRLAQKKQNQNCHPELVEGSQSNKFHPEPAQEKLREKKGTEPNEKIPPILEDILAFFKEKNNSEIEAHKFYNHFQSNGWLVGGKSKMKDWKAAARNWMLNTNKFQPKSNTPQPNHLHTLNSKNYAEPL